MSTTGHRLGMAEITLASGPPPDAGTVISVMARYATEPSTEYAN